MLHQRRDSGEARLRGAHGGAQISADSRMLGERPVTRPRPASSTLPALPAYQDDICDQFEAAWKEALAGGSRPRLEDFLANVPMPELQPLLRELLGLELDYRRQFGEALSLDECQQRFPEMAHEWLTLELSRCGQAAATAPKSSGAAAHHTSRPDKSAPRIRCPLCRGFIQVDAGFGGSVLPRLRWRLSAAGCAVQPVPSLA